MLTIGCAFSAIFGACVLDLVRPCRLLRTRRAASRTRRRSRRRAGPRQTPQVHAYAIVLRPAGSCTYANRTRAGRQQGASAIIRGCSSTASVAPSRVVSGPLAAVDTDLLIVPWFEDDAPARMPGPRRGDRRRSRRARLTSKEFGAQALRALPHADRRPRLARAARRAHRRRAARTTSRRSRCASWPPPPASRREQRRDRARRLRRAPTAPSTDARARAGGRRRADAGGVQRRHATRPAIRRRPRLRRGPSSSLERRDGAGDRAQRRPSRADAFSASAATWRASWRTSRATR